MKASTAYMYGLECLLFLIVIAGLFDFRASNTDRFPVKNHSYAVDKKLTGWTDPRLKRFQNETDMEFTSRINKIVGSSFYFCKYNTTENIFENVASRFSRTYNEVGFLQPNRYCGYCHQASYILANILKRNGIDAAPLGINGHVVVLVKDAGKEYIFDPDYGVGPMPYKDDMTKYIPHIYGDNKAYEWLCKPYATNKDDDYFYSMQWLNDAEKEQNRALYIVKAVYAVCVALFVFHTCFLLWNIFMTRRRRPHAPKTGPERAGAMPAAS